jgi:hypothetical protein
MPGSDDSHSARRSDPPTVSTAALDRDPHGVFRRHRIFTPLIQREDGAYVAILAGDVERLATDPRTRQIETELLRRTVTFSTARGPL